MTQLLLLIPACREILLAHDRKKFRPKELHNASSLSLVLLGKRRWWGSFVSKNNNSN